MGLRGTHSPLESSISQDERLTTDVVAWAGNLHAKARAHAMEVNSPCPASYLCTELS